MNDISLMIKRSMLFDFYGELLTEHQKQVYESFILDDIAISEIAQDLGKSRQSVHELVKRCDKILEDYEEKLHLVEKFERTKQLVNEINSLTTKYKEDGDASCIDRIHAISNDILDTM